MESRSAARQAHPVHLAMRRHRHCGKRQRLWRLQHENNATVTFNEGLKVNADAVNGTAYALKADDGSTITTSKTTTDAVQLIGDLSVQNAGKLNVFLNTADSFLSGSSKKDNNANSKLNLALPPGQNGR